MALSTMTLTGATILGLSALTMTVCPPEPPDRDCPENWCHPPSVVGPPPECKCLEAEDLETQPQSSTTSGTVTVGLPSGWQLQMLKASPDRLALQTDSSEGTITVAVGQLDVNRPSISKWTYEGEFFAPPAVMEGQQPLGVVSWAEPILIRAVNPQGAVVEHAFDMSETAIPLTSTLTGNGVSYTGSVEVGPALVSISATVTYDP